MARWRSSGTSPSPRIHLHLRRGEQVPHGGRRPRHGAATSWVPRSDLGGARPRRLTRSATTAAATSRGGAPRPSVGHPPRGLAAPPAGPNQIDLGWTPNGAPSYRVLRARAPGGPYEDLGTSRRQLQRHERPGRRDHYHVVRSVDDCESDLRPEVLATAVGACALPPDFKARRVQQPPAVTCSLTVGWGDASSPCGGSVTYSIYRDASPAFLPSQASHRQRSCRYELRRRRRPSPGCRPVLRRARPEHRDRAGRGRRDPPVRRAHGVRGGRLGRVGSWPLGRRTARSSSSG